MQTNQNPNLFFQDTLTVQVVDFNDIVPAIPQHTRVLGIFSSSIVSQFQEMQPKCSNLTLENRTSNLEPYF